VRASAQGGSRESCGRSRQRSARRSRLAGSGALSGPLCGGSGGGLPHLGRPGCEDLPEATQVDVLVALVAEPVPARPTELPPMSNAAQYRRWCMRPPGTQGGECLGRYGPSRTPRTRGARRSARERIVQPAGLVSQVHRMHVRRSGLGCWRCCPAACGGEVRRRTTPEQDDQAGASPPGPGFRPWSSRCRPLRTPMRVSRALAST
jgi:hypothetical protein